MLVILSINQQNSEKWIFNRCFLKKCIFTEGEKSGNKERGQKNKENKTPFKAGACPYDGGKKL